MAHVKKKTKIAKCNYFKLKGLNQQSEETPSSRGEHLFRLYI